ncbi:hypothetical protein BCV71DRAFT_89555 [Rhizopus microsporus]|uniref:Uncharacterized protein n=1 Tax=Rhizopus microsporus TaxID=58291 RepID=A0A1X0RKC4_RHIZD|nr:hypothetical protein BCV71DRAFT_89555 [Rhizopus microsporus]
MLYNDLHKRRGKGSKIGRFIRFKQQRTSTPIKNSRNKGTLDSLNHSNTLNNNQKRINTWPSLKKPLKRYLKHVSKRQLFNEQSTIHPQVLDITSIKDYQIYGGHWKPIKHSFYTLICITSEYNTSQTCTFCFKKSYLKK